MKRGLLLTALVASSVTSAAVTALVMLILLPVSIHAQATRTTATGLAVVRSDGLQGLTADVRPAGGGVLQVFGTNGKTVQATLGASGPREGQPLNRANAGLTINDGNGNQVARIGSITENFDSPAGIRLQDAQGNARLLASLDPNGNPSITLLDTGGNVLWSAP